MNHMPTIPEGYEPLGESVHKAPESAPMARFRASPFVWVDPIKIDPRAFVYARHFIRKFVCLTIAPGGLGKSTLLMTEGLSMVTGRSLLGREVSGKLRVWLWNLEDPADELSRRIQAICQHFDISEADIGDRLFVDTGREQELCMAVPGKNGATILEPVVENLVSEIQRNNIDVLIVDPFISSHQLDENNNVQMDTVTKAWGRVADRCNISIALVHHTRKQSGDTETNADSARGAKALVDGARDVRCLTRMTSEEAETAGVDNHRSYFRVYSDKANLAPPSENSEWYRLENVTLANGDYVGVVEPWKWPDPFEELTTAHLARVQIALNGKKYRENIQSSEWAGHAISEILGLDSHDPADRKKIKSCLRTWMKNGALKRGKMVDDYGKERPIIEVGEWA
ncbi:MAG: AAA family ATPase [Pseudomonadota bacterium]